MKYRVYTYLVVCVPFEVEAETQLEAIKIAEGMVDEDSFRLKEAEDAEDIVGFMVDEEGDEEYARTQYYRANSYHPVQEGE
jgi:hypothetical protein